MKFFRVDLLTLLISLFILSSCKNQDAIGLDPDQKLNGNLIVDDNIIINTISEDTVVTSGLAKTPFGYFNDPEIGTTEANIAATLDLPGSSAYTLPSGTVSIDSAVLVLRYADGFYGDSLTSRYKINVYQMDEAVSASKVYYNTKTWKYKSASLLGSKLFNSRTHTGFKITDIVTGAKDTLVTVPAQLRVPISTSFINNNLFAAPAAQLASNSVFQDAVKGLYLTIDKSQSTGNGGNFMLAIDSSSVNVYYRADNNGTIDTSIVSLPLTTRAASIQHTYNAAVQAALANQSTSNSTFYIQGLGGLRTKVSFPSLANIVTQAGGKIVINRAELVITPVPGSTIPFVAQPKIMMYQWDKAHQRAPIQDSYAGNLYQSLAIFGGDLTTTNEYHFIITGYIQDLMAGKTVDYSTFIGAIDTISTVTSGPDFYATAQTAGRLVAVGSVSNQSSANYPYRIKLNVIYTKINN